MTSPKIFLEKKSEESAGNSFSPTDEDRKERFARELLIEDVRRGISNAFTADTTGSVFIDSSTIWSHLQKLPNQSKLTVIANTDETAHFDKKLTEHPELRAMVNEITTQPHTDLYVVVVPEGMKTALKYQAAHHVFSLNNGNKIGIVFLRSNKIDAGALENELAEVSMKVGGPSPSFSLPGVVDLTSDTISVLYRRKLEGRLTPEIASETIKYFNDRPEFGQGGQVDLSQSSKSYLKEKFEERLKLLRLDTIGGRRLVITDDLKLRLE